MKVTARDVYGEPLPWPYTVWCERLGSGRRSKVARDVPPDGSAEFALAWPADYRVRVVCEGHVEVARNVGGSTADLEVSVPVDPSAVVGFTWPDPWPEIPGVVWGDDATVADDRRRGTLLNIWAMCWKTSIALVPVAAFVEEVVEVRDDRIICRVSPAIVAAIMTAHAEHGVDIVTSAFGHEPPDGYDNGPSIKWPEDKTGGLQVSIFTPRTPGEPLLADIDIDEESGIVHAFRAVGHALTGDKTDFVEVQQILAVNGVDAGWRPRVA